jgi:hypothetical protein
VENEAVGDVDARDDDGADLGWLLSGRLRLRRAV